MTDVVSEQPAAIASSPREIAAANPVILSGARWFWWIVGFSVVNTVMAQSGSNTSFVIGLGMTGMSDALFANNMAVGFMVDAVILGCFALLGLQAQRGQLWAFYTGTALYVIDALIFLAVQDWIPIAFHAFALFYIVRGGLALREALAAKT